MKFTHELSLMEIEKLTQEDLQAYAEWNDKQTGFAKEYDEAQGDLSVSKEHDPEYVAQADAYLQELNNRAEMAKSDLDRAVDKALEGKEAISKEYVVKAQAQEKAEDEGINGTMVKAGMGKMMDYQTLQDRQIEGLQKEVSEVAGLKAQVADMRKELQQAKDMERERLQKEIAKTGENVFLRKDYNDEYDENGKLIIPWFEK